MTFVSLVITVLSYSASVFSVLLNASPLVTAREYDQKGSIGANTNVFLGGVLYSAVTWSSYGLFTSTYPMTFANMLGNAVSTYCSLVFLSVARKEEKSGRKLQATTYAKCVVTYLFFIAISVIHLTLCVGLMLMGKLGVAVTITGVEATIAGIFMVSSPLLQAQQIIKSKNAQCLAPLTVLFAFFNTFFWVIVGILKLDIVVFFCNFLGFLACIAQAFMIWYYGRRPTEVEQTDLAIADVPFG